MRRILGLVAFALAVLSPSAALAKQVCVRDEGGYYWIFPKVKKLKPLQVVALQGVYLRMSAPVTGTAYMDGTGVVRIGVLAHTMAPFDPAAPTAGNIAMVNILGDSTFSGTGFYDSDGNYVGDAVATWTSVDCSEALNPT
jgi:hypothetical protein